MGNIDRERVSLYVLRDAVKTARRLAKDMGYVNTSGRGAGRGNLSGFLEAIADGQVMIIGPAVTRDVAAIAAQLGYENVEAWLLDLRVHQLEEELTMMRTIREPERERAILQEGGL